MSAEKYRFLINEDAALVKKNGKDKIERDISQHFSGKVEDICIAAPREITRVLQPLNEGTIPSHRFVIGGGDGTINSVATQFFKMGKIPEFGILPLGTCNNLTRSLGYPKSYVDTLRQLPDMQMQTIDVGSVNDHLFLMIANLDEATLRAFEAREHVRQGSLIKAFRAASASLRGTYMSPLTSIYYAQMEQGNADNSVQIETAKTQIVGHAFFVTTGSIAPAPLLADAILPYPQASQMMSNLYAMDMSSSNNELSLYSFEGRFRNLFGLVKGAFMGNWIEHAALSKSTCSSGEVQISFNKGQDIEPRQITIGLDGEPIQTTTPLTFKKHPKALRMLLPVRS